MSKTIRLEIERAALVSFPTQLQLVAEDTQLRRVPKSAPDPRPNGDLLFQIDSATSPEVSAHLSGSILRVGP